MRVEDLGSVLAQGKGQTVEWFASFDFEILAASVCAFLNSQGGILLCGISAEGQAIGFDHSQKNLQLLNKALLLDLVPRTLVSAQTVEYGNLLILVIEVPEGLDKPYAYQNTIYVRQPISVSGKEEYQTSPADILTIRQLIQSKSIEVERWERRMSVYFQDVYLSNSELERFNLLISKNPNYLNDTPVVQLGILGSHLGLRVRDIFNKNTKTDLSKYPYLLRGLEFLSLVKDGQLTNAGDILLTQLPSQRFPQTRVRAVAFQDKTSESYQDSQLFEGPLLEVFQNTFKFIKRNLPVRSYFNKNSLQREDRLLYPEEALREALVNAFVHRDYADYTGGISVFVYSDRLEITNTGRFPEGIDPEKLMESHHSILRNPDIAHVFYLNGWMERVGRGTKLVIQSCQDWGLPTPSWKSNRQLSVTLTFWTDQDKVSTDQDKDPTDQDTDQDKDPTDQDHTISDPIEKLLSVIQAEEKSTLDIMKMLHLKHRPTFRQNYLDPALEQGLIEMTIPDTPKSKNQKYRLTVKGKKRLKDLQGQV